MRRTPAIQVADDIVEPFRIANGALQFTDEASAGITRLQAPRSFSGGRFTFDEAAQQFRNGAGELIELSEVQRVVNASMDRAAGRLGLGVDDTLARLDADGISLLGRNSGAVEGGTSVTLRPLNPGRLRDLG